MVAIDRYPTESVAVASFSDTTDLSYSMPHQY
jgi:hypothetical protein